MTEERTPGDCPSASEADAAADRPADTAAASLLDYLNTSKDLAELLGKIFLGFIGVCYATGLIVVNTRLNEYGIYSLGLIQSNYITAGILTWLPIVIPLTFMLIGRALLPAKTPGVRGEAGGRARMRGGRLRLFRWAGRYGELLFFIAGLLLLGFASWFAMSIFRLHVTSKWVLPLAGGATVAYGCMWVYGELRRWGRSSSSRAFTSILGLYLFLLLTTHIVYFGRWIYPTIPFYLGGGEPQKVQIIVELTAPTRAALDSNGIEFETIKPRARAAPQQEPQSQEQSQPQPQAGQVAGGAEAKDVTSVELIRSVDLILATENEYIVGGRYSAVSIPRDSVKALIHKGPYTP